MAGRLRQPLRLLQSGAADRKEVHDRYRMGLLVRRQARSRPNQRSLRRTHGKNRNGARRRLFCDARHQHLLLEHADGRGGLHEQALERLQGRVTRAGAGGPRPARFLLRVLLEACCLLRRFRRGDTVAARDRMFGWLYVSPLLLVLVPFFVAPILVVIAVSFFESDGFGGLIANPTLGNYTDIFTSLLTFNLYLETIKFTALTWFFSLIIGFWVAYFLVFHVRSPLLGIGLFLLCTVPFWTSNIIRMISWIPLLGKEGLINKALIKIGVIHE